MKWRPFNRLSWQRKKWMENSYIVTPICFKYSFQTEKKAYISVPKIQRPEILQNHLARKKSSSLKIRQIMVHFCLRKPLHRLKMVFQKPNTANFLQRHLKLATTKTCLTSKISNFSFKIYKMVIKWVKNSLKSKIK